MTRDWLALARALWPTDRIAAGYAIGIHYATRGDPRVARVMLEAHGRADG